MKKSNNLRKHLESVRLLEVNITLHMCKENHDIIVFQWNRLLGIGSLNARTQDDAW